MKEHLQAIDIIIRVQPGHDPALYDHGTRSAYLRGFEAMRAIALAAVRPQHSDVLEPEDFEWAKD